MFACIKYVCYVKYELSVFQDKIRLQEKRQSLSFIWAVAFPDSAMAGKGTLQNLNASFV